MYSLVGQIIAEVKLTWSKVHQYNENKQYPRVWNKGEKGNVLLIPGIGEGWTFLGTIGNRLNKKGYRIHYPITRKETYERIKDISNKLEEYITNKKLVELIVIGHSKGGLVAQDLINRNKIAGTIRKTIIIGCPNKGSIWAYLPIKNIAEMRPSNQYLVNQTRKHRVIFNIFPRWDNIVIPYSSLKLEGALNEVVPTIGHNRILEDPRTWDLIEKEIESRMK